MRIISGAADAGWHNLEDSGAYEWWYVDALSADARTAIVVIWFAGLPFSPDYLTDHERGAKAAALDHVAMFAALYRDGRQVCYALNRHDRADFDASRERLDVRVGPNTITLDGVDVLVHVDVPLLLGGTRLTADLVLEQRQVTVELGGRGAAADHVWNPLAPDCRVRGDVRVVEPRAVGAVDRFEGRGYVDHNYGTRPLTEGIVRWHWGRAHVEDATVVYYRTDLDDGRSETVLASIDPARGTREAQEPRFEATGWRRRILCPRFPTTIRVAGDGVAVDETVRSVLDWGPFYMRFLGDAAVTIDGRERRVPTISEYFDPRGLRARLLRPLIKTRIRRV